MAGAGGWGPSDRSQSLEKGRGLGFDIFIYTYYNT